MKFLFILLFSFTLFAQESLRVAVGEAEAEKDKIVFINSDFSGLEKRKEFAMTIAQIIKSDLAFYKHLYNVVTRDGTNAYSNPNYKEWKEANARFAITSKFEESVVDKVLKLRVSFKVYDTRSETDVMNFSSNLEGELRAFAHDISDQIYQSISGKKSMFKSRIVFVSDKNSRGRNVIKELYIMDFDGQNVKRLTNHKSIVISPAISPDNERVLYSVIKIEEGKQNVDLYELNLKTGKRKVISKRKGINSGAVYSKRSDHIYLTLSFSGNAEIYEMNLNSGNIRKITRNFADDVDPSITADGASMAFLSGRPGKAMIYTLDPRGTEKDVKRISYVGKFNATPRYNPNGKEIVFSSWVDNRFDLYRIDSNGKNLVRLTKNFGSNEEPSYASDGEFIAFASQRILSRRKAIQNLYVMTRDGEILGSITSNFGNCTSPRWTN